MGRGMSCPSAALSNQLCEPEQRGIMVDEQKVFDNTMPLIPSDPLRVQTTKKWPDPCYSNHKIFHGDGLICMPGIWNKFLVILNMEPPLCGQ